jgi:hypothetical protein
VYDPYTEEARLTQAFTLGTPAANTLMQLGNGLYYGTIKEACQARQMTLRQHLHHYPFASRTEYQRMSSLFTFINPLGTPEPHGTKHLTKRLEGAVETAIKVEIRNSPDGKLDLSLLGMPGHVSAAYMQQVQQACDIIFRGILHKPIASALAGNLGIVLEFKGDTLGAGLKEIADATTSQYAMDLLTYFNPAHAVIHKYLHNTATTEVVFLYETQLATLTNELAKGLIPYLHRSVVDRLQLALASSTKVITIQSLLYNLLLAPNTPQQQHVQRMYAVSDVNVPLPDIPIIDLKRMIEDKELAYFLAHGVQPHPNDQSKYDWFKRVLPGKYRQALMALEQVSIGNCNGPHPPLNKFWTMLEEMVSTQESPQPDAISTIHKVGFRPPRDSTPGPRGSVVAKGKWELTREAEVIPDRPNRFDRHSAGRRGDETLDLPGRNRGRDYNRRRSPSEDRTDDSHLREQYERGRQYEEARRRSPDRDFGFSRWDRGFSRSRSREPEQPADGAEGSAPKAEKEKGRTTAEKDTDKTKVASDRKKSRSPSAKPESTALSAESTNHIKNHVAHLQKLRTQLDEK